MSSKILLSPSEVKLKKLLKDDAIVSELCEEKGADILIYSSQGLLGIQRKSLPGDFIQSMTDGRFARSLPLMTEHCTFCRVVCEGSFKFWVDGTLFLGMTKDRKRIRSRYNREAVHGMLNDIEFIYGVMIRYTESVEDTVHYIKSLQRYLDSKKHVGLFRRPKAQGNWGVPSKRDIHLWILQSFQGIGVNTADKIVQRYGRAPLRWNCTAKELSTIAGVRFKQAEEWINCLESSVDTKENVHSTNTGSVCTGNVDTDSISSLRRKLMNSRGE